MEIRRREPEVNTEGELKEVLSDIILQRVYNYSTRGFHETDELSTLTLAAFRDFQLQEF